MPGDLPVAIWASLGLVVVAAYLIGWLLGSRRRARTGSRRPRTAARPAGAPKSAREATTAVAAPAVAASPASRPDRATLGRYRIERQLGRGSMGTVYLGHDSQIGRPVAIKTMALSREFAGPELDEARARFFREAAMAGRLQHRDIVTIFDAGEDQGLAFIAMEYVNGHDLLRHTLPANLLPVPVVVQTMVRVAQALAYAHTQGVVHRDVKPANVMIDLASDSVKVTDFGIARIADACRTRTGMVLGTPSFMSPEHMAGRRVDGRTDLYSLGVMLFQLLTGALPHRAESMAQLMYQIANDPAPDIRTLRPELPEALAKVVALALAKSRDLRYADGHQLAVDLLAAVPILEAMSAGVADLSGEAGFGATVKLTQVDPRHNAEL